MRINRYLAQAGLGSRRACEELVRTGQVTVNGRTETNLAAQIRGNDHVKIGRKLIRAEQTKFMTVALHKPVGYICTASDPEARKTIYELLPKEWPRLFYIGRLDTDSEGLLLLTNDGSMAQRLAHPRYKLPKTYEVVLDREFNVNDTRQLLKGTLIEGKHAKMEEVHRLGLKSVKVVLTQGIKRQIRLMFWRLGYTVQRLSRTQVGEYKLGRLRAGEWKILDEDEVARYFGAKRFAPKPPRARVLRPGEPKTKDDSTASRKA